MIRVNVVTKPASVGQQQTGTHLRQPALMLNYGLADWHKN